MLAGYLPYAETIEDSDVIIISKDGVHLYQASAAGIGGGLRYWVETEDEIYRLADITDLSALVYHPEEEIYKYTWHGAPMTEGNLTEAVYTALNSYGSEPDYMLPKDDDFLSKEVNTAMDAHRSVDVRPEVIQFVSSAEYYQQPIYKNSVEYCRDFNKLYIGWVSINVTDWMSKNLGNNRLMMYGDDTYKYEQWSRIAPSDIENLVPYPESGSPVAYLTMDGEDFYNTMSSSIITNFDSAGSSVEDRINYYTTDGDINVAKTNAWINGLRTGTYNAATSNNNLLNTFFGKTGDYSQDDPTYETPPQPIGYTNAARPSLSINYYLEDRTLGKQTDDAKVRHYNELWNQIEENARDHWAIVYDPVDNPHPGGFNEVDDYVSWCHQHFYLHDEGGGNDKVTGSDDQLDISTQEIPFIAVISCVGYYPNYTLTTIDRASGGGGNEEDGVRFPHSNWPQIIGPVNFPGYHAEKDPHHIYMPAPGETANFSDNGNTYTVTMTPTKETSTIDQLQRGPNICIDYLDPSGYEWEVCLFAASPEWINEADDTLSTGDNEHPIITLEESTTMAIHKLNRITDKVFDHWSFNENYTDYIDTAVFMRRNYYQTGSDPSDPYVNDIYVTIYNTLKEGAGQTMIDNARNLAAQLINETKLIPYRPFKGSEVRIRTNIGINSNEGFKTGVEIVDFDDVTKIDTTSYVDPVTGTAWFKGPVSSNGIEVQRKLIPGTGIQITHTDNGDVITSNGGLEIDVDNVLALMEEGLGVTPSKDVLHNKIKYTLNHDIRVGQNSSDYLTIARTQEQPEPGTYTNKAIDTVDIDIDKVRNAVYDSGHMVIDTGLEATRNTATGQITLKTSAVSDITINGSAAKVSKEKDTTNNRWKVDLQITEGGDDDYDIPLPIPDYINRIFVYKGDWSTAQSYTAPSDGYLFIEAHAGSLTLLPVTIDGFTYNTGLRDASASISDYCNMIFLKEGMTATFGTPTPVASNWANNQNESGNKVWFIPCFTMKNSEFSNNYILPVPNFDATATTISASSIPTVYDEPSWMIYTATVDGIMYSNDSTSGQYKVMPLDDNEASLYGTYFFSHVQSSGGYYQFDCIPIRNGHKYKLQRGGNGRTGIRIVPFKTVSDITDLYSPLCDFANPVTVTPTADNSYHNIFDNSWDTKQPALLVDTMLSTVSYLKLEMNVKVGTSSTYSVFPVVSKDTVGAYSTIPLPRPTDYVSSYKLANSYYNSDSFTLLKFKKFEPPVSLKRILYNGQNLVDANGDVDLTFLKTLIDALDQRVTALENNT